MLAPFLSHLATAQLVSLCIFALTAYALMALLKQQSLPSFLGYKVILLIYLGGCLILQHLDILALILWIVYGSFIVVMFIFLFLWLETKHPLRIQKLTPQVLARSQLLLVILVGGGAINSGVFNAPQPLQVHWLNYYELLAAHNSEEIECLGGALSTDNALPTALVSMLLTLSCITSIVIIINAKKHKGVVLKRQLQMLSTAQKFVFASVRRQILFQQEGRSMFRLNRVHIQGHIRRA